MDATPVPTPPEPPIPSGRVLIVDDDAQIVSFVTEALEDEGYHVLSVADGGAALDLLWGSWNDQPDVILLDMRMPVMDGQSFAEAYRLLPVRQAPIIAMTGARWTAERAAEVGTEGVLPKPFALNDLLARVARCTQSLQVA